MKLKYLLPAATIASVAAAVTPFVTSCNKNENTCSWTQGSTYKPMTPKAKATYASDDDLTKAYRNDVNAKHKIYSDDMVYQYSQSVDFSNFKVDYDIRKVSFTTKSVGKIETYTDVKESKDKSMFRLTFDVKLTANIILDPEAPGSEKSTLQYKNTLIKIVDMPICCTLANSGTGTDVDMLPDKAWANDEKWSLTMPEVKCDEDYNFTIGKNLKYTNKVYASLQGALPTVFEKFAQYLTGCDSNYYSKATR